MSQKVLFGCCAEISGFGHFAETLNWAGSSARTGLIQTIRITNLTILAHDSMLIRSKPFDGLQVELIVIIKINDLTQEKIGTIVGVILPS